MRAICRSGMCLLSLLALGAMAATSASAFSPPEIGGA